jgi:hypothetical protein
LHIILLISIMDAQFVISRSVNVYARGQALVAPVESSEKLMR